MRQGKTASFGLEDKKDLVVQHRTVATVSAQPPTLGLNWTMPIHMYYAWVSGSMPGVWMELQVNPFMDVVALEEISALGRMHVCLTFEI